MGEVVVDRMSPRGWVLSPILKIDFGGAITAFDPTFNTFGGVFLPFVGVLGFSFGVNDDGVGGRFEVGVVVVMVGANVGVVGVVGGLLKKPMGAEYSS